MRYDTVRISGCHRGMHGKYKKWSHLKRQVVELQKTPSSDCYLFCSTATMNMCSKYQKDMILLKQEHAKLAAASSKDVVHRSSSSDESELAIAGSAVASADLASQISQVKPKEGLKKCTTCRKHVGLTGFSCKCGDLFNAVHHYSDEHNCPFDYRNAGQNVIAKANPIIVAKKLNKI
ncbi:hypothetical protein CQW23_27438 [Capsicum baccatum]|uniref:AN1-type domain-containing protein n=1 Tax=Capsicum baccatum TaxID=33114 RepID=A0A2G2VDM5_CAPBA|nr:hypothetical protein CQW23_27438 [Capsicum baccatum]